MSYQLKFLQDCIAVIALLFLLSAAHFYQQEKQKGSLLTFGQIIGHTYYKLIHQTSSFLLTTGKALEEFNKEHEEQKTSDTPSIITYKDTTEPSHKKEMTALNKQIIFIQKMINTDTVLTLHEKNILSELAKECETKLEHLSHFIKKSLIEHKLSHQSINEHSTKLFESYVSKKITSLAENVLHLTIVSYKTLSGKEYDASYCKNTQDILKALVIINHQLKAFIV